MEARISQLIWVSVLPVLERYTNTTRTMGKKRNKYSVELNNIEDSLFAFEVNLVYSTAVKSKTDWVL
ncbi:MAG: hypothetical protein ACJAZ0_002981 [Halioglobus sp.]|jgi:hypothetical protein